MSNPEFDTTLIAAAFRLVAEDGWARLNVAKAARAAGLSVAEARARFPSRNAILLRFGSLADQAALQDAPDEGPERDRLFDLLMHRFDVLQTNRDGIKALMRTLPTDPATALLLACSTRRSMRWMLQGAGIDATGPRGALQESGLLAVWLWTLRAWERDESEDLSATMAALDKALDRAGQAASWLHGKRSDPPPPPPVNAGAGEIDPSAPPAVDPPIVDTIAEPPDVIDPPPPENPPPPSPPEPPPPPTDPAV